VKPICVVKLGSTFEDLASRKGDFDQWVAQRLGLGEDEYRLIHPREDPALPEPRHMGGVVLTGAHEMVTDQEEWSLRVGQWLGQVVGASVPVLGICYGHQLLAQSLGGRAGDNPRGRQFGTVQIHLEPAARSDPLFQGLPESFPGHTCHKQIVLQPPPGAVVLARNSRDACQAMRIGRCCWSVQFHPEFDPDACGEYIRRTSQALSDQGDDPQALLEQVTPTPEATSLLAGFARFCLARQENQDS
jgi:GMP synthase (glutamine-hydrolysing)